MFERCAGNVLSLSLRLPSSNLLLLTSQGPLVVLEIVVFGVVRLNGIEEQITVLLKEWVDAERQVVKVGTEGRGCGEGSLVQSGQGSW